MQTLQTPKQTVIDLFNNSNTVERAVLIKLFGDSFHRPITERIQTIEDAYAELGRKPEDFRPYSQPPNQRQEAMNAMADIWTVVEAANEGWQPDWKNDDEYKWYPFFDMSGDRLVFYGANYWGQGSDVGSRLCFRTRDLAEHFGKKFIEVYEKFMCS